MGSPAIFFGDLTKFLTRGLLLPGGTLAQITALPRNQGAQYFCTDDNKIYTDDGTTLTTAGGSGPTGPQGPQGGVGIAGSQGVAGAQGVQGDIGGTGAQGFQGNAGTTGSNGSQGQQGDIGAQGGTGAQGFQGNAGSGFQGATGTQGPQGVDGAQGYQGDTGVIPTGSMLSQVYYDSSGILSSVPNKNLNAHFGLENYFNLELSDDGYNSLNVDGVDIRPQLNIPNEHYSVFQTHVNIDPDNSGFGFGTNGNALTVLDMSINMIGKSNLGSLEFLKMGINIGNGTDLVSVRGISNSFLFSNFNKVEMTDSVVGFSFQPTFTSDCLFSGNANVSVFTDNLSATGVAMLGYTSFNSNPRIGSIQNNHYFSGFQINPNIGAFTGNAGATAMGIFGNWGTFGATGNFQGIAINPNITSVQYATGLSINMNNVTATGNKKAADFTGDMSVTGDVNIVGALSFSGDLSVGRLNAFASMPLVDGGGNPLSIQSLISQPTAANNTTLTSADTLGTNTACLIQIGDNCNITTQFLGIASLGLPAVASIGNGSYVDRISGAVFALSLDSAQTGIGTIDEVTLCRSLCLPNGITIVTKLVGYKAELPFGDAGIGSWGFYEQDFKGNFFQSNLKIGGTPGSTDIVANSSTGLELENKAVLLARMTTTARDALTAVDGFLIYNTTTGKFQGYAGGAWTDLN